MPRATGKAMVLHPTSTCVYLWVPHTFPIRCRHHDRKLLALLRLLFHITPREGASHPVLSSRSAAASAGCQGTSCHSLRVLPAGTWQRRQREAFGELERHQGSEE